MDKLDKILEKIESLDRKIDSKVEGLERNISGLEGNISGLERNINKRLDSHYTLLKALEGRTETQRADIDSIAINVAKLLGKVDRISNQSRLALSNTAANRLDIDALRENVKELKKGG